MMTTMAISSNSSSRKIGPTISSILYSQIYVKKLELNDPRSLLFLKQSVLISGNRPSYLVKADIRKTDQFGNEDMASAVHAGAGLFFYLTRSF